VPERQKRNVLSEEAKGFAGTQSSEYRNRNARYVTWVIIGVNALLLVVSLTDYRVRIDSGYHISLARWYAAHGTAWWDHINFGPTFGLDTRFVLCINLTSSPFPWREG
jgi:hypothetical protein